MNIPGWSEDMMKSWTEAQQKYWGNLMNMGGNTAGGATVGMPDWADGMEKWWSVVTPQMPLQANEVMNRVFEMGKVYTRLAESAVTATSGAENKNVLEGWMTAMEDGFKGWSANGGAGTSNFAGNNFGEGWQNMMESLGMGAFKNIPVLDNMMSGSEEWQAQMQKMSGLGGNIPQESQAMLAEVTANYQKAMQDYMGAFSGHGVDSMQALRERMEQMGREGANITSLRELYDLWVDVSEEVYQKFAMSDRYQEVYGEMINAFVALKGGIDTVRDTQLQAMRVLTGSDASEQETSAAKPVAKTEAAPEAKPTQTNAPKAKKPAAKVKTAPKAKADKPVAKAKAAPKAKSSESAEAGEPKADKPETKAKAAPKAKSSESAEASAPKADKPAQVASESKPDNLTRIKGLGPKMQEKLIDAGIQTFDQLAALSDDQAQALDKQLDARGRLVRENWVTQASDMSGNKLV